MESEQSSTVARFIHRFREAQPASPRQRHRDRAAMNEQFWWTRSSQDSCSSYPSVRNSHPSYDREELQGLESQGVWDGGKEKENPKEIPQGLISPSRTSSDTQRAATNQHAWIADRSSYENVLGWNPMPSLPSPTPPGPPPSDEDESYTTHPALEGEQQGPEPISSLVSRCSHIPSQDVTTIQDVDDTERKRLDLDMRANMLLERCRELLAAPLVAPGLVTGSTESKAGTGDEDEVKEAGGVLGEFSDSTLQGLEQRARVLLGDTEPLDHHTSSDIAELSWTSDVELSRRRDQQGRPDYPAWNNKVDRSDAMTLSIDWETGPTLPRHAGRESRSKKNSQQILEGSQRGSNFLPRRGETRSLAGVLETLLAHTGGPGVASQIGESSTNELPCGLQIGQSMQGACFSKVALPSAKESGASREAVPLDSPEAQWVAWLDEFIEDPVVKALLQRADYINSELLRRHASHC